MTPVKNTDFPIQKLLGAALIALGAFVIYDKFVKGEETELPATMEDRQDDLTQSYAPNPSDNGNPVMTVRPPQGTDPMREGLSNSEPVITNEQ